MFSITIVVVQSRIKQNKIIIKRPNELKNAIIALGLDKSAEEILRLVEDLDSDGNN